MHAPNLILVAFHIADVTVDPAYLEGEPIFVAAVELGGFRTILNVPILKEDELIGVFAIYRQEVRSFSSRQVELVTNFAAQALPAPRRPNAFWARLPSASDE